MMNERFAGSGAFAGASLPRHAFASCLSAVRTRRNAGKAVLVVAALAVCAFLLLFAAPAPAQAAENTQLDSPVTVSDDVTHVEVSKLNADTHGYVSGATMAIIEEETGEVVDQWVTGSSVHETSKTLDVDTVYILREISAPDGFSKVQDVRFQVNATEGAGITILSSGSDAELTESYKVALYDKPTTSENEVTVTKPTGTTTTTTTVAPKTGDEAPLSLAAALAALGVSAILILQVFKRRMRRDE